MSEAKAVAAHYTRPQLDQVILAAVVKEGLDPERLTAADLAPADEFHVGGLESTQAFSEFMKLQAGMKLLDVGCGIGGPARFFAGEKKCQVTGIDLTNEFVQTAVSLTRMVRLEESAGFQTGSALAMPFAGESFDEAYMFHVGMNIADKRGLCREVARVLRPGGRFAIFDLMRSGDGAISFPVPWAMGEETSFVVDAKTYREALGEAGFAIEHERGRREFAIEFMERMMARAQAQGGPPNLGLHLLMGERAPVMMKNVLLGLKTGVLEPVEMVGVKT